MTTTTDQGPGGLTGGAATLATLACGREATVTGLLRGMPPLRLVPVGVCQCPALRMDGNLCSACLAELALIAAALDDAVGFRALRSSARCEACASGGDGHCAGHQADEDRAAQYRELLARRYSVYLPAA
jgi:hypothetical protein